jgi:hypothetical protein
MHRGRPPGGGDLRCATTCCPAWAIRSGPRSHVISHKNLPLEAARAPSTWRVRALPGPIRESQTCTRGAGREKPSGKSAWNSHRVSGLPAASQETTATGGEGSLRGPSDRGGTSAVSRGSPGYTGAAARVATRISNRNVVVELWV